jgi:predicted outer membrane repeat protein
MKNNTFSWTIIVIFLWCNFTLNAKNVYLSATGDDINDGLSEASAVKTLGRVHAIVATGDIIFVNGTIDIDKDPSASTSKTLGTVYLHPASNTRAGFYFTAGNWNNVTFKGTNNTLDGFVGNNNGRLFFIDGGTHGFENLFFKEGRVLYDDGGHAFWLRNSNLSFKNCVFENNTAARNPENLLAVVGTNGRGGAFRIVTGTTSFDDCVFRNNENTLGSGLFIEGGNVTITGCVFEGNDVSDINGSSGGAIYTWVSGSVGINLNISNTLFKGNQTVGDGGAIAMINLTNRTALKTTLNLTNCAFISNTAQRGGALVLNNIRTGTSDDIVIKNTTFYGNHASVDGGTICLWASQPQSNFTMVNCTMVGNTTNGNVGHGAGIISMNNATYPTSNLNKKLYNCIFDYNRSLSDQHFSDICFRSTPVSNEVEIKNSYIGWTAETADNITYPQNSINYCTSTQYTNATGIVPATEFAYYASNFYGIPLTKNALARQFGNASYLTQYDIVEEDQLGFTRTIVNDNCAVGAVEKTITAFGGVEDDGPISSLKLSENELSQLLVQQHELSLSPNSNHAVLTIYNVSGTILKQGIDRVNIQQLPKGVYVVHVKINETEYTQKIIK